MQHSRRLKLGLLAATVGTSALLFAALALSAPVEIPFYNDDELNLETQGGGHFDVSQPPYAYTSGDGGDDMCALGDISDTDEDNLGYTPANDVRSSLDGSSSDEFDGGLVLWVGDSVFEDSDLSGDQVGEQLTVGPTKLEGLRVKRVETALQGSPTLRSLIKFKNKSKHQTKKRTITWDSDVGADTTEVVWASSSGDQVLSDSDRWFVFADNDTAPGDAVGTMVLYGKGKGVKKTKITDGVADQNGCLDQTIPVKVPAKSSRYLLFFTETHDASADGADLATSDAAKFNKKKPAGELLAGIKKSVKKKVLNWDLVKEPKKH
jgi:hypothetical protein